MFKKIEIGILITFIICIGTLFFFSEKLNDAQISILVFLSIASFIFGSFFLCEIEEE